MIDGVIFDKDGTLFDFRVSWGRWADALVRELTASDDEARRLGTAIGFDIDTGSFAPHSPVIAATPDEIAEVLQPHLPHLGVAALVRHMNARAAEAQMAPAVPLRPLLLGLRGRGLRIGLATNDGEAPARAHLEGAGIDDLFDYVAGFDSGHGAKPEPGMLRAFARQTGIAPDRIAMVGDSRHDLMAGRAAGMRPVAVLTGIADKAELMPLADVVLDDIGALPDWITGLSAA